MTVMEGEALWSLWGERDIALAIFMEQAFRGLAPSPSFLLRQHQVPVSSSGERALNGNERLIFNASKCHPSVLLLQPKVYTVLRHIRDAVMHHFQNVGL